ncbi:PRC-barrel domain-containing protein [Candidatus Saccharibacteria bacterium]|nr:PRC-barrel domain-containing protein [Candidatus Saccharibacteria bacterium]
MLIYASKLIGTPILSVQAGGMIANITDIIVDPDTLKVVAFKVAGPPVDRNENILDVSSVREYSNYGMVIDNIDELVGVEDVIKISKVLALNFDLVGLKVETKKGSKLGKISNYTMTSEDFVVQQIIVKRPPIKSLVDSELTVSCKEIVEVNDYKVIVKDEEKVIKERAEHEDFIPNFVNPFREQGFAPTGNQNLDAQDTE